TLTRLTLTLPSGSAPDASIYGALLYGSAFLDNKTIFPPFADASDAGAAFSIVLNLSYSLPLTPAMGTGSLVTRAATFGLEGGLGNSVRRTRLVSCSSTVHQPPSLRPRS